jgi:hypothetical protein
MHTPTFLIIGAQKCGTTWLHQHLSGHPDVFMPAEKELEFFSYRDHLVNPGLERYLDHFAAAGSAIAIGEATASYFWTGTNSHWSVLPDGFQTNIPATVLEHLGPDLKLIVSLRNPVERVISAYLHYLSMGEITADSEFEEAMHYGGVVDMGFYAQHMRNWLRYYPQEQIKVLMMEADIQANPVATLDSVCHFLALGNHHFDAESVQRIVYPGSKRLTNENGLFVPTDGAMSLNDSEVSEDEQGQQWRQILTADRVQQLKAIFLDDVTDLDLLLGTSLVQRWGLTT